MGQQAQAALDRWRITIFINKKNHVRRADLELKAQAFIGGIRDLMQTVPLASFANADQSGFLKEMHSVRSHAPVGERKVIRIIQSLAAILHSFTILPVLFANGTLAEKLFIIMQEPGGKFPRRGHFITPNGNLVVRAGTTHIMMKNQMLDWF